LPESSRLFYFDKTAYLIKNAKLVIGQSSLALDYAILFKKPIILLNFKINDSIVLSNSSLVNSYYKKLSLKKIDIDKDYNFYIKKNFFRNIFKINNAKYEKFIKFYINFLNKKDDKNKYTIYENVYDCVSKNLKNFL